MFKKSKSDSKSYGIIGLGRFGSALAVELAKAGAEPLVIDGNEEKVREMREYTENAFVVSSLTKRLSRRPEYKTATSWWSASEKRWTYPF